ncbi:Mitochondrial inner membrane organizing system component [Malassezia cuniculi]|uniref:MICOS complex subunit MIC10 n=1 Tax=Malassezia cuniculi TaxID=948313 RepID=A0AAF0EQC2_9BASI|nr:Mitochondrial inner membrane organizing system component [Malassezia cuniculi]
MSAKPQISSEEVLNQKIDLCISNTIVKTGIGFSAGVVLSVLLLRRRTWPVWLGTGFGLGAGYTDCERSFNPVAVPGVRLVPASELVANPSTHFQSLQQRTGEFIGAAKDVAKEEAEKINVQNIREAAQNRFAEIQHAAGEQVQHLKESTQHVIEELNSRTQDVRNDLADVIRATPEDEKVRKL